MSMVLSPSGKYAYVVNQNGNSISQFAIAANGNLKPLTPAAVASLVTPVYMVISGSGKYAYASNILSNDISQYAIDEQGRLSAIPVNAWGDATIPAEVSPRSMVIVGIKPGSM
jgi:6-phosphogluconolactonase (cycloisomerase 2 family)